MQVPKAVIVAAAAIGVAGGSYGLASAASGTAQSSPAPGARDPQHPWGGRRSDETPLTGDALAKVTAVAEAQVAGGTVVRVETDADGNARYEAHMTDANGNPVTVYVDADYKLVSVERRP
jgi:hypothetical protein